MNESEALQKMIAPGTRRPRKYREGVIQIHVTRACDKSCYGCTQGSNLGGKTTFMPPDKFEQAVRSLDGYFGVYGVFGGNPALSPYFFDYCDTLVKLVPREQRGIWCNNPVDEKRTKRMREVFDPSVSNVNVHLDKNAANLFRRFWPEVRIVGEHQDSRHFSPFIAMKDVLKRVCFTCQGHGGLAAPNTVEGFTKCGVCNGTGEVYDEERAWELISDCDINKGWSAMMGMFRGELRAWFCEIAGAQSILHQDDKCERCEGRGKEPFDNVRPDLKDSYSCIQCNGSGYSYPDTGIDLSPKWWPGDNKWWQEPMEYFGGQVRKHCHECSVPLKGYGVLSQESDEKGVEQCSETHEGIYKPKRKGRRVEVVTSLQQLGMGRVEKFTDYMGNTKR